MKMKDGRWLLTVEGLIQEVRSAAADGMNGRRGLCGLAC